MSIEMNEQTSNKRFAIFDIGKSHHDYLEAQTKIFRNDLVEFYVSDYLADYLVYDEKKNTNFKWYIKKENGKNLLFFIKAIININKSDADYIIINTIQGQWLCYLLLPFLLKKTKKMILSIHNINSYIKPNNNVSAKNWIKYRIKNLNFSRACCYNVFGENLKNYLRENLNNTDKKISTLPFCIYESDINKKHQSENTFKIVIPGRVDYNRRNYDDVLELINYLGESEFQVVILGTPNGSRGHKFLDKLHGNKNIVIFDKFVPRDVFEYHMNNANVIFSPLVPSYDHNDFIEFYGLSKESGASFAAIKYSLPLIIPKGIKIMKELCNSSLQYSDSKELKEIVLLLMNEKYYKNLRNNTLQNSLKFEAGEVRKKLQLQLNK